MNHQSQSAYRSSYRPTAITSCYMRIIRSSYFESEYITLKKKFRKIEEDMVFFEKFCHPELGTFLGSHLYKFRLRNSSIPTGQRGGFRIIGLILDDETLLLLSIYSKTRQKYLTVIFFVMGCIGMTMLKWFE